MTNDDIVEIFHSTKMMFIWNRVASVLARYFRTKIVGARHLPQTGPGIIVPNHSGFCGFDVVILTYLINQIAGRHPRIMAHRAYFDMFQLLRMLSESFGLCKASIQSGTEVLEEEELLMVFPEAEDGNFKSSFQMYELQQFHTGFVRMAIKSGSPVIPTLVIGAEESNFNLGKIDLSEFVSHLRIPLPLNVIPLPAKWQVRFMKPISFKKYHPEDAEDQDLVERLTLEIKERMQAELTKHVKARKTIYV